MRILMALALVSCGATLVRAQAIAVPDGAPLETTAQRYPVAAAGYCVVALRDQRQWRPGDAGIAAVFDGRTYLFGDRRQRDIFLARPEAYAPMLGGDCPVTFVQSGRRAAGRVEHAVLYGSRIVLLASADCAQEFASEPTKFAGAELAMGGVCPVTRRLQRREVPGIPATAALHDGLRYLFASAHERRMFLQNPHRYLDLSDEAMPQGATVASAQPATEVRLDRRPWDTARSSKRIRASVAEAGDDAPLPAAPAMGGYCPVTLQQERAWVRGRFEHRVELDGKTFLTRGARERDSLLHDPASFLPALAGDCPVTLVTRGQRAPGSVYHAVEFQGRHYLMADAEARTAFKADPERYASADLAAGGMCVVTRRDEQRETPGLPEHAAWRQGKLYRFAGPEQKQKFLASPDEYGEK
jgi:YHS domain-containing protein